MNNLGGLNAGAITAALFLVEFVGDHAVGPHRHRRHRAGRCTATHGGPPAAPASAPGSSWSWPTRSRPRPDDGRQPPTPAARPRAPAGSSGSSTRSSGSATRSPIPAIIFIGLCVVVIALSAILAAFDVSVTYEVAEQPPIVVEEEDLGGSIAPEIVLPEGEQHL